MGLIKAGIGALGGVLADQWKEFFYCDSLENDVLMVKGQKRISNRSSNTKGSDNVISNGSGIAVADGQCMIIVEQGKVSVNSILVTNPSRTLEEHDTVSVRGKGRFIFEGICRETRKGKLRALIRVYR